MEATLAVEAHRPGAFVRRQRDRHDGQSGRRTILPGDGGLD